MSLKINILKAMLPIAVMLGAVSVVKAQTGIDVQVLNMVSADEQFNITFTIEGENTPTDFQWAPSDGLRVVWGPQKGSSTSISIVNGKRSKSSQTTYTYILLPIKTGTVVIPPATAMAGGKQIVSRETKVEVVAGGASRPSDGGSSGSAGRGADNGGSGSGSSASGVSDSDIFLSLQLSRSSAVVGEPLTATLKLYQRTNISGFEDVRFPGFDGFWSQELQAPSNIEFKRENVDGKIYNAALLRSWTLIPQKAGELSIDPAELVCLVTVRTASSSSRSIFDSFFEDDVRTVRRRVVSKPISVRVRPLPAGAPASFGGGVGSMSMSASLSRDSLLAHEASSLMIKISGSGNISLIEAPKVAFPPDFDVYDVKATQSSSSSKSFEYPFIPRSHGDFVIPPVRYSYYDTASGKYVTLTTDSLRLSVGKAAGSAPALEGGEPVSRPQVAADVRNLGSDIRYITTAVPRFTARGSFFCFSPLFWVILALLLVAFALVWVIWAKVEKGKADTVRTRNRGAERMARKRLEKAGRFLKEGLVSAFYEELHRALMGYAGDKLALDMEDLSREKIVSSLIEAGTPDDLAEGFAALLDECEYARYAPDAGTGSMQQHYTRALDTISSIESGMKKSRSVSRSSVASMALLLLLIPFGANAAPSQEDQWRTGVEAYAAGDYEAALEAWTAISSEGLTSPALECNIGDAYFKMGDNARAILHYERSLKADPSFADARFNLEYAQGFLRDRFDTVPEFFLLPFFRSVSWSLPSDAWAALFLVLLALALAGALLFIFGRSAALKKTGFWLGIVLLALSLGCLSISASQRSQGLRSESAIVLSPVASVRSAPAAEGSRDLFLLHEGTKVGVIGELGSWINVSLPDGRQGWISCGDVEKI